ncbi:hypothetical protein FACS1894105_05110 [Clostridia bacterium]|nr:hypothetical protein FACS1894105_05110 [Clostridia bacterium]
MVTPQDILKKKQFNKSVGGYSIAEVDEFITQLITQYTELYDQCDKYEKKIRLVAERINEMQSEEETISRLAINTQRQCDRMLEESEKVAGDKIRDAKAQAVEIIENAHSTARAAYADIERKATEQINSTQEKSDALLLSAKTRCKNILLEFKQETIAQRDFLRKLKSESVVFHESLVQSYEGQLNRINEDHAALPTVSTVDSYTESVLLESIMKDIRNDAIEIASRNPDIEYDFQKDLDKLAEQAKAHQQTEHTEPESVSKPKSPVDTFMSPAHDDDVKVYEKGKVQIAPIASSGAGTSSDSTQQDGENAPVDSSFESAPTKTFEVPIAQLDAAPLEESITPTKTFEVPVAQIDAVSPDESVTPPEAKEEPTPTVDSDDYIEQVKADNPVTPAVAAEENTQPEDTLSALGIVGDEVSEEEPKEKSKGFLGGLLGGFGKKNKADKRKSQQVSDLSDDDDDDLSDDDDIDSIFNEIHDEDDE